MEPRISDVESVELGYYWRALEPSPGEYDGQPPRAILNDLRKRAGAEGVKYRPPSWAPPDIEDFDPPLTADERDQILLGAVMGQPSGVRSNPESRRLERKVRREVSEMRAQGIAPQPLDD